MTTKEVKIQLDHASFKKNISGNHLQGIDKKLLYHRLVRLQLLNNIKCMAMLVGCMLANHLQEVQ